jgi:hypothetical protein
LQATPSYTTLFEFSKMPDSLRSPPPLDSHFTQGHPPVVRDPKVAEILDQVWPDCGVSPSGGVVMNAADARKLEALFEMFGVPMKVSENSIKTLGRGYEVFVTRYSRFVNLRLCNPSADFRHSLGDWPKLWVDYIEAVAAGDKAGARKLAMRLQPLSMDCKHPPGAGGSR